jgi:hypothetical protein
MMIGSHAREGKTSEKQFSGRCFYIARNSASDCDINVFYDSDDAHLKLAAVPHRLIDMLRLSKE